MLFNDILQSEGGYAHFVEQNAYIFTYCAVVLLKESRLRGSLVGWRRRLMFVYDFSWVLQERCVLFYIDRCCGFDVA